MKVALSVGGFIIGFFAADLVVSLLGLGAFSSPAAGGSGGIGNILGDGS
jgi:hypothetical protein